MAERTTFHVIPDVNSWKVKNEADPKYDALVDDKERAVELARQYAKENVPSQVIIHNQDGKISDEFTYGDDPTNVPG